MDEAEFLFRPHEDADLPFLTDSWGSSYYRGSQAYRTLTPDEFHSFHRPLRSRFFSKANTTVIVCASKNDPWLILGWIALEQLEHTLLIHYLYVKAAFKGHGIARSLILKSVGTVKPPIIFTHKTERAAKILLKKKSEFSNFIYIPNLV